MRSPRFLHVEEHSTIRFQASGLRPDGDDNHGWLLAGELTVRDTPGPVELRVTELQVVDGVLHARASTRVDRFAVGLTTARGMAARHLDIELAITAALR